jgi:hypothetical protein
VFFPAINKSAVLVQSQKGVTTSVNE